MALSFTTPLRNDRLNLVAQKIDGGASGGRIRIYSGIRPSTGGTPTTLLAELTFSDPSFPSASGATMTANSIAEDSSANATGVATWFRAVDSNALFVFDGNVGVSGSDLNLNSTSISLGIIVQINSFILTEGNS